jgi:diketogulonate reductase-like aldo/keto reductase
LPLAKGNVFENTVLQSITKKHWKSVAQIYFRWIIQHDDVVIPKSNSSHRIKENIDFFDFELSPTEMLLVNNLPQMGFRG